MNQYIIFVILLYVFVYEVKSQWIDGNSNQINVDSEWMYYINGNFKLNLINIPGSHDSGTYNIEITEEDMIYRNHDGYELIKFGVYDIAERFGKTQNKNILEQLNSGIRYLDLGLAWDNPNNTTIIAHGPFNCKDENGDDLTLENVLNTCIQFLKENRSETIIVHLKYGRDGWDTYYNVGSHEYYSKYEMTTHILQYISNHLESFYFENRIPVLEEVRNKIVIVTRYNSFPGIDLPIYSIVENINYNITYPQIGDDIYTLCVQDAYRLEEEDKWKAVKNLLTAQEMYNQEESAGVNVIAINFINTEKGILNDVATRLNNKLIYGDNNDDNNPNYVVQDEDLDTKLLDENRPFTLKQGIQYGWIITDFSDENVARRIYQTNKYNRCGIEFGYLICQDNKCCSQYGFCGVTDEYCDIGCQFDFGICNSNITQITSPDGTCGRFNGYSCEPGYCCSQYGYCGDTSDYCGTGCQSNYGTCL